MCGGCDDGGESSNDIGNGVDIFHIINACLDKSPSERPTFKIIEETLSNALKRCRNVDGERKI